LFGVFRALKDIKIWIIGVKNLIVKVDAKYIKGMINNPDVQPNASMNRWISAILLFDFKLQHVPGKEHGPDGLSRRLLAPKDPPVNDDYEEWIDNANAFITTVSVPHQPDSTPWYLAMDTFCIELLNEILPLQSILLPYQQYTPDSPHYAQAFTATVTTPVTPTIPQSDKAKQCDAKLNSIITFLSNPSRPPNISEADFKKLVCLAVGFFMRDG
jgi:hypothetical protein